MAGGAPRDPWGRLSAHTPARIALGRAGASTPTREALAFALAHARARDAVHAPFDAPALVARLKRDGLSALAVESLASDRATYLRRPDWGKRLSPGARIALDVLGKPGGDVAIVLGDGLSAIAAERHGPALIAALRPRLAAAGFGLGPVVVATGARVALGDEIGWRVGARAVLVLIGERPGLSAPEGLGAYLTIGPKVGRSDADRNCVSNIRPEGLPIEAAAFKIVWLIGAALRLGVTGVALKDESDARLDGPREAASLAPP